ncbi:zinc-finger homeodomain protein 1-like [Rhodamnia argentea]|uniref:Zinc-finger homeodomain protein 1-like n=1 Tax=Rhodamnia argentea TaxID=178133 RepID=A0ABM3GV88_9MYRT|nr:zinc-finger homeodomain protein 1-like [Rhodamnia argentea]
MSQAGDKPLPSSRSTSDDTDGQVPPRSSPPYIQREDHDKKGGPSLSGGEGPGVAKYRECQKNHAAAIGGNARDGCGEFMPSGEEGTLNALKCSACNCHRNFHRREILAVHPSIVDTSRGLTLHLLKSDPLNSPTDSGGDETHKVEIVVKKKRRNRTKFTATQKEKMLAFATKAGWRMQKLDEQVVERFCQELGIERRVLKVWIHNNKHHYLPSKR